MSEEEVVLEEPENPEPEAPEPEKTETPEPEKVEFSEAQQAILNEQIGKKVAKQREAERAAEEARRRAQELEEELRKVKEPQRPDIPSPPDPYDDDYEAKMQARDDAIQRAAAYDAQQQALQQQAQQQRQREMEVEQERRRQLAGSYSERAEKLGVNAQELKLAGMQVASFGINDSVAEHILHDDHGPNITLFLSKNPTELEAINGMTPTQAAVYIENTVKPKAMPSKPELAPEPTETVSGAAIPETDGELPGATYE